jgi:hypothetical protein
MRGHGLMQGEAYWVSVKDYFKSCAPGNPTPVTFTQSDQRFDKDSFRADLLRVDAFPERIFLADTECRWPSDVWALLRKNNRRPWLRSRTRDVASVPPHSLVALERPEGAGKDCPGTTRACEHFDGAQHLRPRRRRVASEGREAVERELFGEDSDPNGPKSADRPNASKPLRAGIT